MAEVGAPQGAGLEAVYDARQAAPPASLGTRVSYGFGAVAYGVKDQGFGYFLLLFYSQVVGLDARLVGLAITVALVLDAFSDPIVGYWSDNFRSKWGRRHPFMYASAIPVAATYFLIWSPPVGLTQEQLFAWLVVLAVLIRTFITFYETPSSALAPELSRDYDERSNLLSWRVFFGWVGGNTMSVLMFAAIFPMFVTATIPNGQFNREAYQLYGTIAGALIFAAIVISSAGTHARIAHMHVPAPRQNATLGQIFKELRDTLIEPSFMALFIAAGIGAIAAGLSAALTFYILTFFWEFTGLQIALMTAGVFISAIIGGLMAPVVTRTMGKKRGAMIIGLIAFIGSPLPMVLKLIGVLPEAPWVFWMIFVTGTLDVGLIICFQILVSSMMADLVEQAEVKTGRRSEGVFFAASTFIRKMTSGLGVMAATFVLTMAQFPVGAKPGEVDEGAVFRLGAYYVPTILGLWLAMMAVIATYKLKREDHEENLRKLAAKKG